MKEGRALEGRELLKEIFKNQNEEMKARLIGVRRMVNHPGLKGSSSEEIWADFLRICLPKKYKVATNVQVVDCKGSISDQIDIVIYDHIYVPPILSINENPVYLPAEAVISVFEVKQDIKGSKVEATAGKEKTMDNIDYAIAKIKSVRKLERTSRGFISGGQRKPPIKPSHIIGGILATAKGWEEETTKKKLEQYLKKADNDTLGILDIGCSLDDGFTFALDWNKKEDGVFETDRVYVYSNGKDEVLTTFFFRLLSKILDFGTAPAIDIDKYGEAMEGYGSTVKG